MEKKVWAVSEDGEVEYVSVQKKHLPGIRNILRNSFFLHENVSIACDIPGNDKAVEELEELTVRALKDGVSVVAIEKSTQELVGGAFNKIQMKNDTEADNFFENFAKNCKSSSSKALVQFMIDADGACNLFELCKIDCLMEIMFLTVRSDFGRRGIGRKLCEISLQLARELKNGKNVKQPFDSNSLSLEPAPKAVSAIFTTFKSQAIGRKLGFKIAKKISFEEFVYLGNTFASKIEKESPFTTVEYIKL